jgi:hypothetical protein
MPVSNRPLRMLVDPPRRQPMPYGLFTVVEERPVDDPHLLGGVEYQALCGGAGTTFDYCVTGGPGPGFSATASRPVRAALPFTVFSEVDCAPIGDTWEQAGDDARNILQTTEQYQVENVFWTGTVGGLSNQQYPHLAANSAVTSSIVTGGLQVTLQTQAVIVSGGPLSPVSAIGQLEGALAACYDGQGIIHVPETAIPALANLNMLKERGGRLYTQNGNAIVAGAGYTGTSPSGVTPTPGTTWMYATGQVFMYRGAIQTVARESESLDRSTNTLKMRAYRTYVLGWDCCHFAVQINAG